MRRRILVSALTVILLLTPLFWWGYEVNAGEDESGPVITKLSPAPGSRVMTSDVKAVSFRFKDSATVDSSVFLQVDGQTLVPDVKWGGIYEIISGVMYKVRIGDNFTKGSVTAQLPGLTAGAHTVYFKIKDDHGNVTENKYTFTAEDNQGPIITQCYPQNGATITERTPAITAKISDVSNIVDESVYLKTVSLSAYETVIEDGLTPLLPQVGDLQLFAVQSVSGPSISELAPAPGSTTSSGAPLFRLRFSDPNKLDPAVIVKVDNQSVSPLIAWDGIYRIEYSSCGEPYAVRVGDDYTKGVVTAQLPQLTAGQHEIYYCLKNKLGGITESTYVFTIADSQAPQVTPQSPIAGAVIADPKPTIKVKIIDTSPIAAPSVLMKFNGTPVIALFDPITSLVTYTVPQPMLNGTYPVEVTVSDIFGNTGTKTWSFTIKDITPPSITNLSPVDKSCLASAKPVIEASVSDISGISNPVSVQIDGQNFEIQFNSETGKVSYIPAASLSEGQHTVIITVKDRQGNTANKSWIFSIDLSGPGVTELQPAPGVVESISPMFSLKFNDPNKLDPNIVVKVDNQILVTTIAWNPIYGDIVDEWGYNVTVRSGDDYTKGVITAPMSQLTPGQHEIYYSLKDRLGNNTEYTYSINVSDASGPRLTSYSPAVNATISYAKPVIKAQLVEANPIVTESVYMKLDGNRVSSYYDLAKRTVTYQPDQFLQNGVHTVQVFSTDGMGNSSLNSWIFTVKDVTPPGFSALTPVDNIRDASPLISAKLTDENDIDFNRVILTLNGQQAMPLTNLGGVVSYKPNVTLAKGVYTVAIAAYDNMNNYNSIGWTFNIIDFGAPQISNLIPPPRTGTRNLRPKISAKVVQTGGIDLSKLSLTVDGISQTVKFEPDSPGSIIGGVVSAVPAEALSEGFHSVVVTAFGSSGYKMTKSWQFGVNTSDYMGANIEDCTLCHRETTAALEQRHYSSASNCGLCHDDAKGPLSGCTTCHPSTISEHSQAAPPPIEKTFIHAASGCTTCHSSGYWDTIYTHGSPTEIATHKYSQLGQNCVSCHSADLTKEHNMYAEGRVVYDCSTCHLSSDANVKAAINAGNTACSACHGEVNHDALHVSGIDSACTTCHSENLIGDHITTRPDKNLSCNTCHTEWSSVLTTGDTNSKSCSRCHSAAHGLPIMTSVPGDIPLYPEIEWTVPIDSRIFNDAWMPQEFAVNAKLLISKRYATISGNSVWNFYQEQLVSQGWKLETNAPAQDSDFFEVVFSKNQRRIRISFYGGENHTDQPRVSSGFRIEILYK